MRKNVVAGNWKMNKTLQEGVALANELKAALQGVQIKCDVVVAPPLTHVAGVVEAVKGSKIGVAAQNCANKDKGAYTGEVSTEMIASIGAGYVIIGHSERREYYGETNATIKEKIVLALQSGLVPIVCFGEVLAEREAEKHFDVVKTQVQEAMFDFSAEDFGKLILAYEPVWAIGTGKTASAEQAQEIHAYVRGIIVEKYGQQVADDCTILYGGSCNPTNANELFSNLDVDGGLIGGASLKVEDFMGIIQAF